MPDKLKVLLVDDSQTARRLMFQAVSDAPDMQVVGEAMDGAEAVTLTGKLSPDVILMDIVMPQLDGLQATREIMHVKPTPIVLISASLENQETDIAFQAIKAGALTVLPKPAGPGSASYAREMTLVLSTLRAMAQVQVIHHWVRTEKPVSKVEARPTSMPAAAPQIVAIASSTGGPAALSDILKQLPRDFPVPIVIVQHIAPDFVPSLTEWLRTVTRLHIEIARPGDTPRPGTVYFAPGSAHLRLNGLRCFELDPCQGTSRHMPSGNVLLESVAKTYGAGAVGIVLTGMGDDGARGLRAMYDAGAFTIAQDQATCVVFGMPQEAIQLGAARQVLPLPDIAQALVNLAQPIGGIK